MKLAHFALLSVMFSGSLAAQDIKIVGTITQSVKLPAAPLSTAKNSSREATETTQKIKLLKIQLSVQAKQNLDSRAKSALASSNQFAARALSSKYPKKVDLGMNDVPVLNQGMHGSCVTFANTAAVDAALDQGDYISQLCQLQLGNYLEKNGYAPSGWNGSWGRIVLNQMDAFGIVNKTQQHNQGCGGLKQYPLNNVNNTDGSMNLEEYHQISETVGEQVFWTPVLDVYQALTERIDTNKTVDAVKAALNSGDRLTFAVLLLDFDLGFVGAVGKNKAEGDSWVLTPEIARDVYLNPNFGGHEMVITGYDDDAVAIDDQGREHRGLFSLRNSWGNKVGDQGNFYMSYDYFKLLVIEVQRIRKTDNENG